MNTPFLDQAYGRRELVKFLAHNIDSGQVLALMLITSRGLKVVQGLDGDPAHLVQALNKVATEMSSMETFSTDAQEISYRRFSGVRTIGRLRRGPGS